MGNPRLSRRRLLRGAATTAGGLAAAGTAHGVDPLADGDYDETEYGYVDAGYEPPAIGDRPVILTVDGYAHGSPSHYVELRDGELMAVDVATTPDERAWRAPPVSEDHVCVHASIRGTGCSGGTFDLYDRVHARDGYEVVEWLADRGWSSGRVGLYGYSYSGFTGFFIAAEQPPSLECASVSLLTDDLYRGLVFRGGVPNTVFPSYWALVRREGADYQSAFEGAVEDGDAICAQNVATREPVHPADEEAAWYTRREDDSHWRSRSLGTYADRIEAPIYIGHAWQDEQTDARGGPELFATVDPEPASPPGTPGVENGRDHLHRSPKLLRATNGIHATGEAVADEDARAWFDYWLRGEDTGIMDGDPVELHVNRGTGSHATTGLADWPGPDTDWTRYHLRDGGDLTRDAPGDDEPAATYQTGSPRRSWFFEAPEAGREVAYADGPDLLAYRSPAFEEPRLLAGPITATLYLESTAPEFDLYAGLGVERDGSLTPLQRGMLRASHDQLDEDRTWYNDAGDVVRPYRPHTSPEPVEPGAVDAYEIEIFPAGHLLYPGDRLFLGVTTPPLLDGLSGYEPSRAAGVNTVYQDAARPSNVHLPLHAWDADLPERPACGDPTGYRCIDVDGEE